MQFLHNFNKKNKSIYFLYFYSFRFTLINKIGFKNIYGQLVKFTILLNFFGIL